MIWPHTKPGLKNLLYLYISHISITNYDIERTDFKSWGFQDIDKCDSNMTIWLINLIKLIKKQKIHNMDKETMVDFDSSGFCWNKDKKLVIFNER